MTDTLKRDPSVGATVWSFVITDYGMARYSGEDGLDLPVRQAWSTRSAALAAAKAAVADWMLDDTDETWRNQEIRDEIHDDARWLPQHGEDLLWSTGDGPDETRCRVYPIIICM